MLMPRLWNDNFFDDWMNDFPTKYFGDGYDVEIDLPGFNKDDIHAELEDGYLTVTASRDANEDQKDDNGKYVRRERYVGKCSRSYYVGEGITENDIQAKFENGILTMHIPKKDQKQVENKKFIAIEG